MLYMLRQGCSHQTEQSGYKSKQYIFSEILISFILYQMLQVETNKEYLQVLNKREKCHWKVSKERKQNPTKQ